MVVKWFVDGERGEFQVNVILELITVFDRAHAKFDLMFTCLLLAGNEEVV